MQLNWSFFTKVATFFLISVIFVEATLSPGDKSNKKGSKSKELKIKSGPQSQNVIQRNLVDEEPSAKDILIENAAYYKDTQTRLFDGTVLGYVTPWNNHGYDVAKTWGPKFDIISPVWFQVLRLDSTQYEIGGIHDIDEGWMKSVRKAGLGRTKILPRILFDKFSDNDFSKLLTYEEERRAVANLIVDACIRHKFDGIVLEVWTQLSARVDDDYLMRLVIEIATALKEHNFDCILVVPPTRKETYDLFSRRHFEALYPVVTAFSMMTYDFSSTQRPGANAPLYWVRNAVEHICPKSAKNFKEKRAKILLGLNLYGNDFTPDGGGPIIGHEYLSLLRYVKGRLTLDDTDRENFFEVKAPNGRHVVFYPTLFSINERLELAREMGTGISMWELGQGLDYFYDLL